MKTNLRGMAAMWLLVLTFISCIAFQAAAVGSESRFRVTGVVVDSVGTGESFATLRVYADGDSIRSAAAMGVADVDGVFSLSLPSAGVYDLKVSATGKEDVERTFEVTETTPVYDAGTLVAVTASNLLGEVEVTAQRPVVVREIDRIGYDVQADDDSKTQNLDEILKKVPLVTVDPDGTIKVKGSTDFKIYKNNRPNNSFSKNAKDIFKAIPASMIKRIEVITDPGAREDAEGVGVVLNIVTMENTVIKGVMGNVSTSWNSLNLTPGGNLWLTSQINKVTFSISGGYNHASRRASRQESEIYRNYPETGNEMISRSSSRSSADVFWIDTDASYELDSLNLFTMEFGGYGYSGNDDSHTSTQMRSSATKEPIYSYNRRSHTSPFGYIDFNGNFNYQHSTRRKGETFTLSYAISTTKQERKSTEVYEDAVNMPVPYTRLNSDFDLRFIEQTVQADWTRPINAVHKFDIGGKFIHRKNHSISTNEYIPSPTDHSNFSHLTVIGAVYADYRLKFKRFGARAGVRYEYSHLAAKYLDGSQDPFGSDLNDVVPNAAVSWNINDANSLKLSYSSSISRPGINYLNPIRNISPTSVSYGNPRLGSARMQSFNLNYGLISSRLNIDYTAGYSFSNNGIISSQWTDGNDVTYSTYINGGRTRNFFTGMYFQLSAGPKTTLMSNASARYNYQRNPSLNIHVNGWSGSVWGRVQQKLPWKLTASLDISYWTGSTSLYSKMRSVGQSVIDYRIGLRRAFLKEDRLNVNIMVNNPIGSSRDYYRNTEMNTGYTGSQTFISHNRKSLYISISWRFGSLNASVKKTAKTITNDDLDGQKK